MKKEIFLRKAAALAAMAVAAALIATEVLAVAGCQDSLAIKDFVQQRVNDANTHLKLIEISTSTNIVESGTTTWPDTIFTETSSRTFRLSNIGPDNVTLIGENPVAVIGGTGQEAYGNIVQPLQRVLQPGDSTTFSISFTPPAPDTDYICSIVINSDDSMNPAFRFNGRGHSTQWHGSKAIVSTPSGISYNYPKIAIAQSPIIGKSIYVVYQKYNSSTSSDRGIFMRYSTDGGNSWSQESIVVLSATNSISGFSFAASANYLHILYYDSTSGSQTYMVSAAPPNTISFQGVSSGTFSYATSYYTINNNAIVLANGKVYVVIYKNTAPNTLTLAVRPSETTPTYGEPGFGGYIYPITDGSTHTGGFNASLKVDSNNAYITYADGIYIRSVVVPLSSISNNSTYSYSLVAKDPNSYNQALNSLIVDSDSAYALWSRASDFAIRSAFSTDLTLSSWSSQVPLNSENTQFSPMLGFIRADSVLYALYEKSENSSYSIRLSVSNDGGTTWKSSFVDGPNNGLGSSGCSMVRSGSDFYIVYSTGSGHVNGYSITLKKSLDGGATW